MITESKNKMQKAKKIKKKEVIKNRDKHICVKCGFEKITLSEDGSFICPNCGTFNE